MYDQKDLKQPALYVRVLPIPSTEYSVRLVLASLVWGEGRRSGLCILSPGGTFRPLLGAINYSEGTPSHVVINLPELLRDHRSFDDFDVYTMQRDIVEWMRFRSWKTLVQAEAKRSPLDCSSVLKIIPNAFFKQYIPRRSPYPSLQIPPETENILNSQKRRPRDGNIDTLLEQDHPTFEVDRVIRSSPNHWSQVFVGHLSNSESLLCLKLFDDRHFHMPTEPYFGDKRPTEQLLGFFPPSDLIMNEESIYHRCRELQGLLLPHCYGFHEVLTFFL